MFDEVFFVSQIAKLFLQIFPENGVVYSAVALNKTKRFFLIATRLKCSVSFFLSANSPTLKFEHCRHKESFIAIIYRR